MEAGSCGVRGAARVAEPNGTDPSPDPETIARSYQLEALEKAKKENTIVFLETGSGKTLIAVMLLRSYAFAIRKPSRHIAVFLVPTVVLVTQQAKVIELHTDLKVGKFWGEMGVDFWNAATWKENLEEFEVFVMTPQILLDNLRHTFFKLSDIKLIIFDECHHARGRHPYACIMTEFYHRCLESLSCELPRIFGMTASLGYSTGSNPHVSFKHQIRELENLMNSKVYTVDSESVLSAYISFPNLKVKLYEHIDSAHQRFIPVMEHLKFLKTKHIGAIDEQDSVTKTSLAKKISKLHATFGYCLKDLGAWLALKAAKSLTCSQNYLFFWGENVDEAGENAIKAFIQEVFEVLSSYVPQEIYIGDALKENVDSGLLTSKVECLVKYLLEYRDLQEMRCIIFVERIITAIVIHSLLEDIKGLSGRTKYMAGSRKLLHSQSRKEQTKIVDSFHDGKVNVIVATQILEEGLDVRECNLVIRFDPATSSCSFIQSRGRARMKGSDYLMLIRCGDTDTLSKVVNFLKSGDMMREESRKQASIPCKSLQTNMLLDEIYCVESTGAIVTMNSSVALIYFYCSRLPSDEYFRPHPRFEFEEDSNKCTLCLPKSSPIPVVHAECGSTMQKQLLCLEACKKLHAVGALNDYLLPDVEIEDTQLSEVEPYNNEQADYFPNDLVDSWFSFCCLGLYHCYKITIDQHFNYDSAFNDMMLIVKTDLGSNFLSYSFGLKDSRGPVSVQLNYAGIVHLSREQVMMAKSFQISIFNILLHRDYSKLMDSLDCLHKNQISTAIAYLLVPFVGGRVDWQCVKSSCFHMGIAEHTAHSCASKGPFSLVQTMSGPACSCMLQRCIVYTPHSGKFYCVNGFLSDLNINSTFMLKDGRVLSYKEYFQSRHDVVLTCENQPLLSGRHLFKVENYLHNRSFRMEQVNSDASVELPPELCTIIMSPVSANTVYTFSFAPSIMHRIQCLLLAARLKKNILTDSMQNIDVPVSMVLEAITRKNCQEEFSLESLETLGDSFLKYAVNQNLFRTYKHHHEGILSAKKDKLVSNVALCMLGCDRHFPGFIRNRQFDPQEWFIPGSCAAHFEETSLFPNSSCTFTSRTRTLKSKAIADTVEALIGVFLTAAGEKAAFKFIEWLGIKMEFDQETTPERNDLLKYEKYININDLQLLLNYSFRNPSLLLEALTHASYQIPDVPGCYQRLEFLGDAVLDFLMTWYLYNKYPGLSPGMLTDLRSANVSNDCYARAAIRARLNKHILHASSELHKRMTCYLEFFANSLVASSDVSDAGADPPKVLGDVIESIAGAIFVDSGYNKEVVWCSMKPLLEPMVSPETVEQNPVQELQHLCSKKHYQLTCKKTIENHKINMTAKVEAEGTTHTETITGPNKKTAQRMVAKALLRVLKSRAASES